MISRLIRNGRRHLSGVLVAGACVGSPVSAGDNSVLQRDESNCQEWTVHIEVRLHPWQPRVRQDEHIQSTRYLTFREGAIVFPLLNGSASHDTEAAKAKSKLNIDNRVASDEPRLISGRQAGTQIGVWEMHDVNTRDLNLQLDIPMKCYETKIDERRAFEIPWPVDTEWNDEIASALKPQLYVESDDPAVRALVEKWTNGKPKKVKPYFLAKYLAAKTLEHVQPSGNKYATDSRGPKVGTFTSIFFSGFEMEGAAVAAKTGRGRPYDTANLLAAVYRAAGIPARLVIGYDTELSKKNERPEFRPWVEFYLFDEARDEGEWIPVDIIKQREFSSRAPQIERPWEFFGTNRELDTICPVAYHWHPPTTVQSAGAPALWGWIAVPGNPRADQELRIWAQHTVKRGGQR